MRFYIKEARQHAGMSQAELSRRSGVARSSIIGMESGEKTDCSTKTLCALADALGVSVVALLSR